MTFEEIKINSNNDIKFSGRKYPSRITDVKGKPYEETAEELIQKEIYKAKMEILRNEKDNDDFKFELEEIEELKYLFNKHIKSNNPIAQIRIGTEKLPLIINSVNEYITEEINFLNDSIMEHTSRQDGRITNIRRICLKNVALILEIDGIKRHTYYAEHLLAENDINIDSKKSPNKKQIGSYKLLNRFSTLRTSNKLNK